jgi:hypothetical protein
MNIVKRLQLTLSSVWWHKRNRNYLLMQFIEKSTGKQYNYYPSYPPSSYADTCHIICVFRIREKKVPFSRMFMHYWKKYGG